MNLAALESLKGKAFRMLARAYKKDCFGGVNIVNILQYRLKLSLLKPDKALPKIFHVQFIKSVILFFSRFPNQNEFNLYSNLPDGAAQAGLRR